MLTNTAGNDMIAAILPDEVIAVEARSDALHPMLFPQEEAALGHAVEKRRREFATTRACARSALAALGLPPLPIPMGLRGEPVWPPGVVGSITHCDGYRACAVARLPTTATIGIDAEPHRPLPDGVLDVIALPSERVHIDALARSVPAVCWDRLLFSAKESVYKAWFQLTAHALGFEDAALAFDPRRRGFTARLLLAGRLPVDGPSPGVSAEGVRVSPRTLTGRWLVRDGLVLTAIALRGG